MTKQVSIVAPASFWRATTKEKAKIATFFKKGGYRVIWASHAQKQETAVGALDVQKVLDLNQAFGRGDLVLALRGGYGTARLLPKIDWKKMKKSSSVFVGFSDTTTFQNAYFSKTKKPSVSGMLAMYLVGKADPALTHSFWNVVNGGGIDFNGLPYFAAGRAQGVMLGGNLTCFAALIGTPYMPNMRGKILLLEDVGEAPYRIDRMLTHLKNAGVFDRVKGVVLGSFHNCLNDEETQEGEVYHVLKRFFSGFKIPVVYGVPYGHEAQHFCLPFGTKTVIDTTKSILHIDGLQKKV